VGKALIIIKPSLRGYHVQMVYKDKAKQRENHKKYMRKWSKTAIEKHKHNIRLQSQRIYGKVPKGYQRHHLNYDSPHNFILIPIREHIKIHRIQT